MRALWALEPVPDPSREAVGQQDELDERECAPEPRQVRKDRDTFEEVLIVMVQEPVHEGEVERAADR
jgi:hypothetical protein